MDKNVDMVDIFLSCRCFIKIGIIVIFKKIGDGAPMLSIQPITKNEFFKKIGDKIQQGQMIMPFLAIQLL
jgi:hypothetical protein